MNPKVSLIIPVYKVEKYLAKCLSSVEAQTYDNFETILVDDGSPDRCGEMCDAYAASHENVIVIHQQNQGLSAARNNGMKAATGEYFVFIDSDDFVSTDYLEYLVGIARKYDADLVCGHLTVFMTESKINHACALDEQSSISKIEAMKAICYAHPFGVSACAKCYRRELFNEICYPAGKLYEDLATTYKIVDAAKKIAYGNKDIYFNRKHEESIMHQKVSDKNVSDGMAAAQAQMDFISERYPEAILAAKSRYAIKIVEYLSVLFSERPINRELFSKLRNRIRPIGKTVMKDPMAGRLLKMKILCLYLGFFPTRVLFYFIQKIKQKVL